jgi:hypothetical protein
MMVAVRAYLLSGTSGLTQAIHGNGRRGEPDGAFIEAVRRFPASKHRVRC